MSELVLTRDERLQLRARAHHLNPVVLLGAAGLTEAVLKETDRALSAHELIKVRIPGDDRDTREAIAADIADKLSAARVQIIGKLLVLYRPRPDEAVPTPPPLRRPPVARRRHGQASGRQAAGKKPAPARAARGQPRRGGSRSR